MDITWWLIIANAAVWLGIGAYLVFLGARQKRLAESLRQLEIAQNERDD